MKQLVLTYALLSAGAFGFAQGPYAPHAEATGTDAIWFENELFVSWVSSIELVRGYKDLANKSIGKVNFGTPEDALGTSDKSAVSLGDSGVAVLTFNGWVLNKPGADFAVFENSFNNDFLELAFVEVSKNGVDYVRFPSHSLTAGISQIGSFDALDASNLNNLAGKYKVQYGTPFDLDDVGLDSVKYIRIVDVVGSINPSIASKDSKGNIINDPYPTDFQNNGFYTGGFDLEAVGLIHYEGEIFLGSREINAYSSNLNVYPNPAIDFIHLNVSESGVLKLFNNQGEVVLENKVNEQERISLNNIPAGAYLLQFNGQNRNAIQRLLVQ